MQYTSKVALLAVALFGTSAIALPFAQEAEYDMEARETDNYLSAREFYNSYLEARADPVLNARDLEALEFEARDYFNYLEARAESAKATEADTADAAVGSLSPTKTRLATSSQVAPETGTAESTKTSEVGEPKSSTKKKTKQQKKADKKARKAKAKAAKKEKKEKERDANKNKLLKEERRNDGNMDYASEVKAGNAGKDFVQAEDSGRGKSRDNSTSSRTATSTLSSAQQY